MSGGPILLDSRRSAPALASTQARRRAATPAVTRDGGWDHLHDLERQMRDDPARDGPEGADRQAILPMQATPAQATADPSTGLPPTLPMIALTQLIRTKDTS